MTLVGVVLEVSDALRAAFELEPPAQRLFLRGDQVRAVTYPSSVRWLGARGALRLGAAVVDGKVLPCVDAGAARPTSRGAGLVVSVRERGESLMLIDARVISLRACEPTRAGRVAFDGEEIPAADPVRCFDELQRLARELGRNLRAGDREPRKTP